MKSEHSFTCKRRLFSKNWPLFLPILFLFLAIISCSGSGGIGGSGAAPTLAPSADNLQNTNPAAAATVASSLQQLPTDTTAALATATTQLGTAGTSALAMAASTLNATEFQNLATLIANLDQSTVSGLGSAMTVEAFGSTQGGIAPTMAFSTGLTTTDIQAVVTALNTDLGTVPLAASDSLTQTQKNLYDYVAGLRVNAQMNTTLKNAFNGAYNALDQVKSNGTAVTAVTNLVNSTSGSASDLSAINSLLAQITSSSTTFKATQDLFKAADSNEVKAIQDIFKASVKDGKVNATTLASITNVVTEAGTGTPAEVAQKQAEALKQLLTIQHPGYTVTVTVTDLANNVFTTTARLTGPFTSVGPITALGSIVVNGVTFDTTGATVTLAGVNGNVNDLQIGMVVKVEGEINVDGKTGKANAIAFDPNALGPITAIDLTTNTLTVMGQRVLVDGQTVFAGLTDNTIGLAGLAVSDLTEISGLANTNGNIKATRITRKTVAGQPTVSGRVSSPTAGAFKINGLDVNSSSAQLSKFGPEGIQSGDFVEVRGNLTLPATLLAATVEKQSLDFKYLLITIDGFIDSLSYTGQSVSGFGIITHFGLQRVALSTSTQFSGGQLDTIQAATRVKVEGTIQNNVIQATKLSFL